MGIEIDNKNLGNARPFTFTGNGGFAGFNVINNDLMSFEKTLKEVIESRFTVNGIDIGIIPLDRKNHRLLPLDVMLITVRDENDSEKSKNLRGVYAVAICKSTLRPVGANDDFYGRVE